MATTTTQPQNGTASKKTSSSNGSQSKSKPRTFRSPHLWSLLPYVLAVVGLMQAWYWLVYWLYDSGHTTVFGLPPLDAAACASAAVVGTNAVEKCGRSDMFAFQIVSGTTFVGIGGWAFYDWHVLQRNNSVRSKSTTTALGRLYGHHPTAQWITVVNLAYQLWDFAISLTIPEYCTAIMMTHHVVAATVAWSALYNDMLGYYALFFLGLSEVSSIFLVSMDVASSYFELRPGSLAQLFFQHVTGPLFAGTFIYYRVILWWPTSWQLAQDVVEVVSTTRTAGDDTSKSDQVRPGRNWILYLWVVLNFPMGLLQLYWMSLILDEVRVVVAAL